MGFDAEHAQAEADQLSLIEKRAIEVGLEEGEHYRRGPGPHEITLFTASHGVTVAGVRTSRAFLEKVAREHGVRVRDETHEHDREGLEDFTYSSLDLAVGEVPSDDDRRRDLITDPNADDPFYGPREAAQYREAQRAHDLRFYLDPRVQVEGSPLDEDTAVHPFGESVLSASETEAYTNLHPGSREFDGQQFRDKDKAERVRESMAVNRLKGVMRGWGAVTSSEAPMTTEELRRIKDYVDARLALVVRFPPEPELNDEGPTVVTFTRTMGGRAYAYAALRVPAGMQEGRWVVTGPQSPAYLTWEDLMIWVESGTPSTQRVVVHVSAGWDISTP